MGENVMVDLSRIDWETSTKAPLTSEISDSSPRSLLSKSSPTSVKVIDFDTFDESPCSRISRVVVGTNQYIAQEAYAGKYSPRSDVFAAGVIAYVLLSDRWPFNHEIFDDKPGENWTGSPKMLEIREKLKVSG